MKRKITGIVVLMLCMAGLIPADDAERTTIIPGVVHWAKGCCDNQGWSWIEITGRDFLHHSNKFDGLIMLGVVVACVVSGFVIVRRRIKMAANHIGRYELPRQLLPQWSGRQERPKDSVLLVSSMHPAGSPSLRQHAESESSTFRCRGA
jgi:hypothetical protein